MKEMWRINQFFPNIMLSMAPIKECKLGEIIVFMGRFLARGRWLYCTVIYGICLFKALAEMKLILLISMEKSFEAPSTLWLLVLGAESRLGWGQRVLQSSSAALYLACHQLSMSHI